MFKAGDYVRCVDDYGRTQSVKNGDIYQVESLHTIKDFIRLKGIDDDVLFAPERFKKALKVKATRLAKKLYPNTKEEDGVLVVDV